jgi:hypothetical protein
MRDAKGNALLKFTQDTKNPLEPALITPGILADLTVTVEQNGLWAETVGMISGTPSFELNIGNQNIPLGTEPPGPLFGLGLFVPVGNFSFIPLTLPSPPPACAADPEKPCR